MNLQVVLKTSLFSLLAIALALVGIEGVARLSEPYLLNNDDAKTYLIPSKGQDVLRVFVYGGSTVVGHPLPEFGFVEQITYGIKRSHPSRQFEVWNFGKSGGSSTHVLNKLKATLYGKPDLIIVCTGHNEFLNPVVDGVSQSIVAFMERNFSTVRAMKSVLTVQFRKQEVSREAISPEQLPIYDRRSDEFLVRVEKYSANLTEIVSVAKDASIPIILGTLPSNMLDWPPVFRRIGNGKSYEDRVGEILISIDMNNLSEAQAVLSSPVDEMSADDPIRLYLEGLLSHRMGRFEGVQQKIMDAKDYDPLPWRVLSIFNKKVLELEEEHEGVFVVDIEKAFQGLSPGGAIGKALVADNCHPTPLGYSVMAIEFIHVIMEKVWDPDITIRLRQDEFLESYLQSFSKSNTRKLWLRYYLENAKYAMKPPFFNYSVAMSHLEEASRIDPSHFEVLLNKATLHLFMGEITKGTQELAAAKRVANGPIDPDNRRYAPYLKEALEHSATFLELN